MSAQEFVLIPKENYVKDQPKALEIVDDPTLSQKAHHLTLLQRQPHDDQKADEKTDAKPKTDEAKDKKEKHSVQTRVLQSISMLKPSQIEKSKQILKKLGENADIAINDEGLLEIGERPTSIDATSFLYNLQQTKKQLHDPEYETILKKLDITPQLVANTYAKQIVKPKSGKSKVLSLPTTKLYKQTPKKARRDEQQPSSPTESEEETPKPWETFQK